MPFLSVLGITVGVARSTHKVVKIGDTSETLMSERDRFVDVRDEWEIETEPMSGDDAASLECLLDGRAHVFPFDSDYWSKAGQPPVSTSGLIRGAAAPAPKHGTNRLECDTGDFQALIDFLVDPAVWTVVVWKWNGAAWIWYLVRSDGVKFVDGARNDGASTTWLTVDGTTGTLTLDNGTDPFYDDLGVFPGLISLTHAPQLFTFHEDLPLSALRKLTIAGSLFEGTAGDTKTVRALNVQRAARPFSNPTTGAWDNRGAAITCRLVEAKVA